MTTATSVPVIDISPCFSGDHAARLAVARQIDEACRRIGFLVIAGHSVPGELRQAVRAQAAAFFDLPLDQKQGVTARGPDSTIRRGYRGMETGTLARSRNETGVPDHRELFNMGPFRSDPSDPYFTSEDGRRFIIDNVFPPGLPEFEPTMRRYYEAMDRLAQTLMRAFALALGLPETWFDAKVDRSISALQLSNYPEQLEPPREGQLRASAHSDFGSLTILDAEDKPGGLEVFTADQGWRPVPVVPGAFIVNIGDLMAQWTNDRWVSTLHRVVNPARDRASGSRRLSLVFFHQPNYDALIECLSPGPGVPVKYQPITSGAYLRMRIAQTFHVPT
ncbi:MAG: isopenicillin N synthase family oxygenase [Proteobacteria bacterium]|nr:isopenicillin N synthase family oxygenase [Pseudomonadota bacterium]